MPSNEPSTHNPVRTIVVEILEIFSTIIIDLNNNSCVLSSPLTVVFFFSKLLLFFFASLRSGRGICSTALESTEASN